MRKTLLLLLCLASFVACQESMEERAERDARETTAKRCPLRMSDDGSLILERIVFDKTTHTWRQNYLLDCDREVLIDEAVIRDALLKELRNTPSYKPYMDNGFNFQYIYCQMKNPKDTLINITLTTKDYSD